MTDKRVFSLTPLKGIPILFFIHYKVQRSPLPSLKASGDTSVPGSTFRVLNTSQRSVHASEPLNREPLNLEPFFLLLNYFSCIIFI